MNTTLTIVTGNRCKEHQRRHGLTLVELMMVAVVIAILSAMVVVGVYSAKVYAKDVQLGQEIGTMDQAIKAYASAHPTGGYPPTIGGLPKGNSFIAHLYESYPRFYQGTYQGKSNEEAVIYRIHDTYLPFDWAESQKTPPKLFITSIDPAETLVTWLGGLPDQAFASVLLPFSKRAIDPLAPRQGDGAVQQREEAKYEFKVDRLSDHDNDGWPEYMPPLGSTAPPYVYFGADVLGAVGQGVVSYPGYGGENVEEHTKLAQQFGVAVPYASYETQSDPPVLVPANQNSFQIICSGQDLNYGSGARRMSNGMVWNGSSWAPSQGGDKDNITNVKSGQLGSSED